MVEALRLGRSRGYSSGGVVGVQPVAVAGGGENRAMQIVLVDTDREAKRLAKNTEIDTRIVQVARANRYQIFG